MPRCTNIDAILFRSFTTFVLSSAIPLFPEMGCFLLFRFFSGCCALSSPRCQTHFRLARHPFSFYEESSHLSLSLFSNEKKGLFHDENHDCASPNGCLWQRSGRSPGKGRGIL